MTTHTFCVATETDVVTSTSLRDLGRLTPKPSHHPVLQDSPLCSARLPPAARQSPLLHSWRTAFVNVIRCLQCISLSGCLESISVVPTASPGTWVNPATSAVHDRRTLLPPSHLKRELTYSVLCPVRPPKTVFFLTDVAKNETSRGLKSLPLH